MGCTLSKTSHLEVAIYIVYCIKHTIHTFFTVKFPLTISKIKKNHAKTFSDSQVTDVKNNCQEIINALYDYKESNFTNSDNVKTNILKNLAEIRTFFNDYMTFIIETDNKKEFPIQYLKEKSYFIEGKVFQEMLKERPNIKLFFDNIYASLFVVLEELQSFIPYVLDLEPTSGDIDQMIRTFQYTEVTENKETQQGPRQYRRDFEKSSSNPSSNPSVSSVTNGNEFLNNVSGLINDAFKGGGEDACDLYVNATIKYTLNNENVERIVRHINTFDDVEQGDIPVVITINNQEYIKHTTEEYLRKLKDVQSGNGTLKWSRTKNNIRMKNGKIKPIYVDGNDRVSIIVDSTHVVLDKKYIRWKK